MHELFRSPVPATQESVFRLGGEVRSFALAGMSPPFQRARLSFASAARSGTGGERSCLSLCGPSPVVVARVRPRPSSCGLSPVSEAP